MIVVAAELAAVIAGADAQCAALRARVSTIAASPARIAAATDSLVRPSITISSTEAISGLSALSTAPFRVGQ